MPVTPELIAQALDCSLSDAQTNLQFILDALNEQGILDRATLIAAIATIGVECGGFKPIKEYGDDSYFTDNYEWRDDLGNKYPGDGAYFCGRGFIQITGRANYRTYGQRLNVDLENNPGLALDPKIGAQILALYFKDRGIPELARQGNWEGVRRAVNGGLNGWGEFTYFVVQCDRLFPDTIVPSLLRSPAPRVKKPTKFLIKGETWLKHTVGSAADLPPSEKVLLGAGLIIECSDYWDDKNHWNLVIDPNVYPQELLIAINNRVGPWRLFKDHCQVVDDSPRSSVVDLVAAPVLINQVINQDPSQLKNKDVQQILINLGLLDPPADGKWGIQSKTSLQDFQGFVGLPPTGELTPETKVALVEAKPFIKLDDTYPSRVIRYMQSQGYFVAAGDRRWNIVMIEAVDPDTGRLVPDRPNEFCDARILIEIPFSGIPRIVGAWEATCKAGYYYVDNPMNPAGTARCDRSQFKAWQLGEHGHRMPHEALVQVAPVTVRRYHGQNDYYSETNGTLDKGLFGINFHWGYDYPKTDIGQASAGCLVGRTTEGHRNCMRVVKRDRRFQVDNSCTFFITVISGKNIQ